MDSGTCRGRIRNLQGQNPAPESYTVLNYLTQGETWKGQWSMGIKFNSSPRLRRGSLQLEINLFSNLVPVTSPVCVDRKILPKVGRRLGRVAYALQEVLSNFQDYNLWPRKEGHVHICVMQSILCLPQSNCLIILTKIMSVRVYVPLLNLPFMHNIINYYFLCNP